MEAVAADRRGLDPSAGCIPMRAGEVNQNLRQLPSVCVDDAPKGRIANLVHVLPCAAAPAYTSSDVGEVRNRRMVADRTAEQQ